MTNTSSAETSISPGELQSHLTSYDSIKLLAVGGMAEIYQAKLFGVDGFDIVSTQ